jgi:hypothetical protein
MAAQAMIRRTNADIHSPPFTHHNSEKESKMQLRFPKASLTGNKIAFIIKLKSVYHEEGSSPKYAVIV